MPRPTPLEHLTFVRLLCEQIDSVEYSHFAEGSAYVVGRKLERIYEGRADAWRTALRDLAALGFVELSVARGQGMIPADWTPE